VSCCDIPADHAPSPQPWRLQALDQAGGRSVVAVSSGDGCCFLRQISDQLPPIDQSSICLVKVVSQKPA